MLKKLFFVTLFILCLACNSITIAQTPIRILDLYDNTAYHPGVIADWGFSCLITGAEKTILFDTGKDGAILMSNMKKLGVDPMEIDIVYLSHIHSDHIGGLDDLLEINPKVTLCIPQTFLKDKEFFDLIKKYSSKVISITKPQSICNRVYTTGKMGTDIIEQSLIIRTSQGIAIITGCAHPGILNIIVQAPRVVEGDILYVLGGFHLLEKDQDAILEIVKQFKSSGVRYISPTHCTGTFQIGVFETEYQPNFIPVGVGRMITQDDLK